MVLLLAEGAAPCVPVATAARRGGAWGASCYCWQSVADTALLDSTLNNMSLVAAVNSVLAIGGVGGLAVGLAGREILENLFTGLIILSSSPFEVGDEVLFTPPTGNVSPASSLHLCCMLHPLASCGLQIKLPSHVLLPIFCPIQL